LFSTKPTSYTDLVIIVIIILFRTQGTYAL